MIEYKNTIDSFYDLYDLCWSGALYRLQQIAVNGLEDEFMNYIKYYFANFADIPTLTEINDFIWFECDEWIKLMTQGDENNED